MAILFEAQAAQPAAKNLQRAGEWIKNNQKNQKKICEHRNNHRKTIEKPNEDPMLALRIAQTLRRVAASLDHSHMK